MPLRGKSKLTRNFPGDVFIHEFNIIQNAWLPFANPPDIFHRYVADTALGRWCTRKIFEIVSWDFITSNLQRDLPQTIPNNPLSGALSGALHVTPVSYLESVRDRKIEIFEGHITLLHGDKAHIVDKSGSAQIVKADNVIVATGYNLVSNGSVTFETP